MPSEVSGNYRSTLSRRRARSRSGSFTAPSLNSCQTSSFSAVAMHRTVLNLTPCRLPDSISWKCFNFSPALSANDS